MIPAARPRVPQVKRPVLALAALASALAALHGLLWLLGGRLLQWQTESLLAAAAQHGWTVSADQREVGGWPLAATLTIDRPSIAGGDRSLPGGLAWSADRLVARVSLLHPLTLLLSAEGQQFLRLSHAPDIGFTATRTQARLGLWTGRLGWGTLEADGVAGGIAGSRNPQDVQVAALRLSVHQVGAPAEGGGAPASVAIDLRARGIGLPDVGHWPLGATIAQAGAELVLVTLPPPPRAASDPDGSRAAAQAAAWRDAGGRLRVSRALLHWGPLRLDGAAELGLDASLQPAGSGTVEVAGTGPALDAAAGGGLIAPGVALTAKAVLELMPRGEAGAVRLPFVLRDQTVSVGQIPLARVGAITW